MSRSGEETEHGKPPLLEGVDGDRGNHNETSRERTITAQLLPQTWGI